MSLPPWRRNEPAEVKPDAGPLVEAVLGSRLPDPRGVGMTPLLEIDDAVMLFGGLRALDGVTLAVQRGEILGIVGPNGAGKTTLMSLISGTLRPSSGSIRFVGRHIERLRPHQRARLGIARTAQIVQPFMAMTALENVMVGAFFGRRDIHDRAAAQSEASLILDRVGLKAKQDVQAASLSIPERRRMELARALAADPVLLLLDEVMAGLMPREVDDLVGLVREVRGSGVTIIVVEHVMRAIVELSDRVVVLQLGRVLLQGAPTEVLRDARVVASYLGEHAGRSAIRP